MADIVEFTLSELHQNVLYKIPKDGFIFYVKSEPPVCFALFDELDAKWKFLINVSNSTWHVTSRETGNLVQIRPNLENLLSQHEYQKFWVRVTNLMLCVGVDDNSSPVFFTSCSESIMKYVTFFGPRGGVSHWKVLLPQKLEKPLRFKINKGALRWVTADNQLPHGSLIGGFERECLYIIRAKHRGSLTPGKFVPSLGVGFISWGGEAHEKDDFEVLCGFDCEWVRTKGNNIPVEAVEAGHSEGQNSEILYVGRALHDGYLIPGKVQPSHKVCYVPFGNSEVAHDEYEVLIRPHSNKYVTGNQFRSIRVAANHERAQNERDMYDDELFHESDYE